MGRQQRRRLLPALRLPDGLCLPPAERCAALALQSLPQGFLGYVRDAVRIPQDAAAGLPDGRRDLRNEVKGKSMLALSRDLGTQYKTAFVLAHKIREAMASESKGARSAARARRRSMAAISAATSSRRTFARTGGIVGCGRTNPASARSWS